MKKIVATLLLFGFFSFLHAQTVPWVQYTPTPRTPSRSYNTPLPRIEDSYEDAQRERYHYENQIVESEIINSSAVSSNTGNVYSIQVKTEIKRNGNYKLTCIGIKMNNKWASCECDLVDVQTLYQQAKTQEEKSAFLELMEYASFVFTYGNTLYLIPKAD